ncbi:deoxyadenosine/deoxycytidine kinase [Chitinivorax tropicus]|uniref:Deoxyadenosine/deoxycytidine kinase n=1 Tax=Chitinivorax tropicus TaxID=714531 RepID=A0A840MMG2_9PROT|nr:deoxynucleoside kinase [Chitinivorax tropicus]MBB5018127.1 deoxyadenosine/deoxycytidine kinase [Chitinivorax tropicus]
MDLAQCRYIVVEGLIGAGKTSLAKQLSTHLQALPILESPESNPFLAKFYQDPSRYALQTQLSFLLQRTEQLAPLQQLDMFSTQVVSDYMLAKELIFAEQNLSDEEWRLYRSIYQSYSPEAPRPDLVIYLQLPVSIAMQRIQQRARSYETGIEEQYLKQLAERYSRYFHSYDDSPLLIVNASQLNLVDDDGDFELLLQCIKQMRGGREFFNKG